jgi:hypothetical protein
MVGYVAGAERGRWHLIRQRHVEEARAAHREHRARRAIEKPALRLHAIDPETGRSVCGYGDTVALSTAWFDTPTAYRCAECVWRMAT